MTPPDAADDLFDWYSEFTHERHPRSLADFYVAYRALVRTKVNVLRAKQDHADAADAARRFFALCRRRLAAALPVVVMVGGSPGTGSLSAAVFPNSSFTSGGSSFAVRNM